MIIVGVDAMVARLILALLVMAAVPVLVVIACLPLLMFDSPYGYWGRWKQLLFPRWVERQQWGWLESRATWRNDGQEKRGQKTRWLKLERWKSRRVTEPAASPPAAPQTTRE